MKVYKTNEEVKKDIVDGMLRIEDDVRFECDVNINAHISARNISAWNISAGDISARNISARNISAVDISAKDIKAENISYHAFCIAYGNIECKSIKGRRKKHQEPICLDGKLTIKEKHTIVIDGKEIELSKESYEELKRSLN